MELKIRIKNIKSIKETYLHLKRGMNILIGPNGSGKTCTLFSLKFLRDIIVYGAAQAVARGGGKKRVYHRDEIFIEFEIVHDYGLRTYRRKKVPMSFRWYIRISQGGVDNLSIVSNEIFQIFVKNNKRSILEVEIDRNRSLAKKYNYSFCPPNDFGRDLFKIWDVVFKGEDKNKISQKFNHELTNFLDAITKDSEQSLFSYFSSLDIEIEKVYVLLKGIDEYNIIPDIARSSVEQLPTAYMKPNGEGVADVIHSLEKKYFNKIERASLTTHGEVEFVGYRRINSLFRRPSSLYYLLSRRDGLSTALDNIQKELAAAVSVIDNVTTTIDETNGKRYVLFKSGNQVFSPEEVSDGTIKWLCILVSIYVPISTIYLLEEPENFLHPWMQQKLISNMREQAKEKEIIYFLTSHSATVLNAAEPQEILVVTSSFEKGTTVKALSNRDEIEELLESSNFRLGDLWVSGMIEGVPGNG
ncbi:hypothetical protein FACHB389_31150 [Nostoc calcicola FACHB-389]|nr:AAA family ATPase [Nostoc calcicola FACHB-3891]OKH22127.1 hypothetical protein FACHB389_31150 [Nostoc calcicola FACHB-389]